MNLRPIRTSVLALLILVPFSAVAQSPSPSSEPSNQQLLNSKELDALVAPVALYADSLLAEVLIAATYPLEVVQAERWATGNKNLKGEQLKAQVDKQAWDESVKSLVATPSVLTMMSTKLDWTQKLGDAVLAQQPDVMDAVQRMRSRAQANNKLTSTKEQKVTVKQEQNKQVIAIESAAPGTIRYGICAGALGRRLLGRRDQLERRRQQYPDQPRRPRRALAAQSPAPPRGEVRQHKRAAEIRQQRSSGWKRREERFPRPQWRTGAQARRRPRQTRRSRTGCASGR